MKSTLRRTDFLFIAVLVFSSSLPAQSNSSDAHLSGKLTDLSGYGVGNVKVTAQIANGTNPRIWSTVSADDGAYLLAIPAGHYRIHFQHSSFVARDVILDVAASANRVLDLRLEIERVSEHVVVTANAQPLEVDRTPAPVDLIGLQEIQQRQAVSLPDLLATQSGISLARTGPIGGLTTIFVDGGTPASQKFSSTARPSIFPGAT